MSKIALEKRTFTCGKHGSFVLFLPPGTILFNLMEYCPKCCHERSTPEGQRAEEAECRALMADEVLQQAAERSGIPLRFRGKRLDNFKAETERQKYALDFAVKYVSGALSPYESGASAIFCGMPGTGKTHLACGIGNSVLARGDDVIYTSALRAVRRVTEAWKRNSSETESQAVSAFTEPRLLILDDIGVQYGSDAEKIILFDILNERYENRLPSLLISNLPLDGVRSLFGEKIFNRLREDGGEYIPFGWSSYRGKGESK